MKHVCASRNTLLATRQRCFLWLVSMGMFAAVLAACAPHSGGDVLAFLRAGHLWTITSDGSAAQEIAGGDVVGFAWSPDHHQMVFRTSKLASTVAAALPVASTFGAPDAPGELGVIGINGGTALQITPNANGLLRSDAWWNANGNRLLYREAQAVSGGGAEAPGYVVSQADQPAGIARKPLMKGASLPVLSPDGTQVAMVDSDGNLRVGPPGASGNMIATGALLTLPTTERPAHLLWQPHHNALLYAVSAPTGITLLLRDLAGGTRQLGTISALLDAAFSPDGSLLLVRTPQSFELWRVASEATPLFSWPETDPTALPWWSPSGRILLIEDASGWQVVNVANQVILPLLNNTTPLSEPAITSQTVWHPAAGSPWNPEGTQIVFVSTGNALWHGKPLPMPKGTGTGLYVVSLAADGNTGEPLLIESGADRSPSWSYLDPSTTFLVAS